MPKMTPMQAAKDFENKLRKDGIKTKPVEDGDFTPEQISGAIPQDRVHTSLIQGGILWVLRGSTLGFLTLWGYVAEKTEKGDWVLADVIIYNDLSLTRPLTDEDLTRLIQTKKDMV